MNGFAFGCPFGVPNISVKITRRSCRCGCTSKLRSNERRGLEPSMPFPVSLNSSIVCKFVTRNFAEGPSGGREEIASRLKLQFPKTYQSIEYGSSSPKRVAILTGSGQSALPNLLANNVDTLITGELRQHHFNMAQELKLNLYQ